MRDELKQDGEGAFPGKGHVRAEEAELTLLRRENERLREERSILKSVAREDRKLQVEIRAVFRRSRGRYGSPRVYRELRQQGVLCGENRVARLMKKDGLQARRDRVSR